MKSKFKSYSFWMTLTAGVVLVINTIGEVFGFSINNTQVTNIISSICGVLVILGLITKDKTEETTETTEDNAEKNIEENTKQITKNDNENENQK